MSKNSITEPVQFGPRKPESWRSWLYRLHLNYMYPCYFVSGAKITYLSPDYREYRIRMHLGLLTKNKVGVMFGGSMFAATDAYFMLILIQALGSKYLVWDIEGGIKFKKPGRKTLYARFAIDDAKLDEIKAALAGGARKVVPTFVADLVDIDGVVHAQTTHAVYIRLKTEEEIQAETRDVRNAA